ncbi:MAG: hypothetical protein Q3971_09190, partial [Moraxella sp.]|nr:hypothetical protein [Moraxella sp.]
MNEPSFAKSLLVSVVLHAFIVAGVLLLARPKPLPEVVSMQADLVGSGDMAGIQGQIAKAYAQNQAKSQISTTQSTPTTVSQPSPSYDYDQISQREAEYLAQMKAYAEALDQDIVSEMRAYQHALNEADKERQRQVDELERRERSNDDIARENA